MPNHMSHHQQMSSEMIAFDLSNIHRNKLNLYQCFGIGPTVMEACPPDHVNKSF